MLFKTPTLIKTHSLPTGWMQEESQSHITFALFRIDATSNKASELLTMKEN